MNYALEYAKYVQDPVYCIEQNFQTFDNTQGGYVPYRLFPLQKNMINCYEKWRHNIVAKPRQAGITTTTAAYIAVKIALATPDQPERIEILANNLAQSQEFLSKIREFTDQIPIWMWGDYYNWDKKKGGHIVGKGAAKRLEFVNGSYVAAKPCTRDALRGTAPTFLIIDEAAFVEEGATTYAASAAAVATGGKMIIISTPNGMDELYYKTYVGSLNGENSFNIVRFHWAHDPRYNGDLEWIIKNPDGSEKEKVAEKEFTENSIQEKLLKGWEPTSEWFRQMCADLNHNKRMIAQELQVKFEGSGGNVISYEHIEYYENVMVKPPKRKEGIDNNVWIWEDPVEGHKYIAGVDPSRGDSTDYSTISIIDLDEMKVVLEYRGQINNELFAGIVETYCNRYRALTVIDATGGYADVVIHILEKNDFKFFYRDEYDEDVKNTDKDENKKSKIGFRLQKYRHPAISNFVGKIEKRLIEVYSVRQVNEWKTYVWLNGRQDHQKGFNDDCIMSLVMPLWVAESVYNKIEKAKELSKVMLYSYLGFGIKAEDIEKRKQMSAGQNAHADKVKKLNKIYGKENAWIFY